MWGVVCGGWYGVWKRMLGGRNYMAIKHVCYGIYATMAAMEMVAMRCSRRSWLLWDAPRGHSCCGDGCYGGAPGGEGVFLLPPPTGEDS